MAEPEICDTCGQPIVPHVDAVYSIADPGPRHWDCHQRVHLGGHGSLREKIVADVADFEEKYRRATESLEALRQAIRRDR